MFGGLVNENSVNGSRTVAHIDVDAFEWQVVCRENPDYVGCPGIVVNPPNKIVAVSYEARHLGIFRKPVQTVREAVARCPDLIVHYKEMEFGKPAQHALRRYSREVKDTIVSFLVNNKLDVALDYAGNDEFYLDITKEVNKAILQGNDIQKAVRAQPGPQRFCLESTNRQSKDQITYRIGQLHPKDKRRYEDEVRLIHGAVLVSKIITAIREATEFTCSGGISHNMLLAKVGCSLNKPNGITMLPLAGISRVSKKVKVGSIPGLGGGGPTSFGAKLRLMGIHSMYQLQHASMGELNRVFKAENCHRLIAWAHGISHDVVVERQVKATISCGKEYVKVDTKGSLLFWFGEKRLGGELWERLEEERMYNSRRPKKISIMMANGTVGTVQWRPGETIGSMLEAIRQQLSATYFKFPVEGSLKLFVPEFIQLN